MTRNVGVIILGAAILAIAACSSPQKRAAKAQAEAAEAAAEASKLEAEYKRRRLEKISEYEECVAASDPASVEACDTILQTLQAFQ